ncbi:hypothetical protein [Latilactobacillus sakei]|uniref:hypothetical protein n=1 Tax=Latilactobacillus sakei TaxID=1599 RepID=UPI002030CDD4|nr:hypothetical protein [Latilactobacillus sakei]MCM1635824.1 hypothetical protein [Latilactobacillus sakei]
MAGRKSKETNVYEDFDIFMGVRLLYRFGAGLTRTDPIEVHSQVKPWERRFDVLYEKKEITDSRDRAAGKIYKILTAYEPNNVYLKHLDSAGKDRPTKSTNITSGDVKKTEFRKDTRMVRQHSATNIGQIKSGNKHPHPLMWTMVIILAVVMIAAPILTSTLNSTRAQTTTNNGKIIIPDSSSTSSFPKARSSVSEPKKSTSITQKKKAPVAVSEEKSANKTAVTFSSEKIKPTVDQLFKVDGDSTLFTHTDPNGAAYEYGAKFQFEKEQYAKDWATAQKEYWTDKGFTTPHVYPNSDKYELVFSK